MGHHVRHNPTKDSTVQKYLAEKINIFLNAPGIDSGTLASILDAFSFKPLYPILSLNIDFFSIRSPNREVCNVEEFSDLF
jgi:hypothetical protein